MTTVISPSYRIRQRSEDNFKSKGISRYTYSSGTAYSDYPSSANGTFSYMTDTVFKRWAERSAKGEVMMGEATSRKCTVASEQTSLFYGEQGGWSRHEPGHDAMYYFTYATLTATSKPYDKRFSLLTRADYDSLCTEVSTRCLSDIHTGVGNAENLAEIGTTVRMLRHPIASFWKWHSRAKARSFAMSTANAWLMYRYGIRPLMSSVVDTLDVLQKENKPLRVTTRARGSLTANSSIVTSGQVGSNNSADLGIQQTESIEVRATSIDEVIGGTATQLGFGAKDLLVLPWELVPYSFVADWFVNTGEFLGALAQSFHPKSLGRCLTTRHIFTDMRTLSNYRKSSTAPSNYYVITPVAGWWRSDDLFFVREPFLRAPGLVIKADFRSHDLTRIADGLALVGQAILRTFTRR